jgi:hypothetical protein
MVEMKKNGTLTTEQIAKDWENLMKNPINRIIFERLSEI